MPYPDTGNLLYVLSPRPRPKASDDDLLKEYQRTKSVWKTGARFGLAGQTVHKRLQRIGGVQFSNNPISSEEDAAIRKVYKEGFRRGDGKLRALCQAINRDIHVVSRRARQLGLSNIHRPCSPEACDAIGKRMRRWMQENEHPRGYRGKIHSPTTRMKLSQKCQAAWDDPNSRFHSQEYRQLKSDGMLERMRSGAWKPGGYSRSQRGWWENGTKRFFMRSKWEMNYAWYLEWLVGQKQIAAWDYECDTFWFEAIRRGVRSYMPDFKVTNNDGTTEYHEVKGWMDPKSKTKLKRMAKYHPDVKMVVIDPASYRAIAKHGRLFPGWE